VALAVVGRVALEVAIPGKLIKHLFTVVTDVRVPLMLGNEVLDSHKAWMGFLGDGVRELHFDVDDCEICEQLGKPRVEKERGCGKGAASACEDAERPRGKGSPRGYPDKGPPSGGAASPPGRDPIS
jgi:hypothetical protein